MGRIILFLLIGLGLWACKNDPGEINKLARKAIPTEVATKVEVIYSDSSIIKAKLNAPTMVRYLSDTAPVVEMPKGVDVLFYSKGLVVNSKLRANYGIRYINKNYTVVRGNVMVVNPKGDTLRTEELIWQQDKERVYTPRFVRVKTKKEIILADGFESDVNFTNYKFYKVRATLSVPVEE